MMNKVFTPAQLGPVTLRNRVIKAATFEGRTPDALVTDDLIEFHREHAAGGVAISTVAYCAVSSEGRTDRHQIWMRDEAVPGLRRLTDAIHSEGALAAAAGKLSLGAHLVIGRGEELTGGREKPSILADAFEALIGAVYLDGGVNSARRFVLRFLGDQITEAVEAGGIRDFKTELQEAAHRAGLGECSYRTACETGPDHRKEFVVQVLIGGEVRGEGGGQSKKAAEQQAARAALMRLHL